MFNYFKKNKDFISFENILKYYLEDLYSSSSVYFARSLLPLKVLMARIIMYESNVKFIFKKISKVLKIVRVFFFYCDIVQKMGLMSASK